MFLSVCDESVHPGTTVRPRDIVTALSLLGLLYDLCPRNLYDRIESVSCHFTKPGFFSFDIVVECAGERDVVSEAFEVCWSQQEAECAVAALCGRVTMRVALFQRTEADKTAS